MTVLEYREHEPHPDDGPIVVDMTRATYRDSAVPVAVRKCTECEQDIYLEECSIGDGLGSDLCEDCFRELIRKRAMENISLLATELGYMVVRHV